MKKLNISENCIEDVFDGSNGIVDHYTIRGLIEDDLIRTLKLSTEVEFQYLPELSLMSEDGLSIRIVFKGDRNTFLQRFEKYHFWKLIELEPFEVIYPESQP